MENKPETHRAVEDTFVCAVAEKERQAFLSAEKNPRINLTLKIPVASLPPANRPPKGNALWVCDTPPPFALSRSNQLLTHGYIPAGGKNQPCR